MLHDKIMIDRSCSLRCTFSCVDNVPRLAKLLMSCLGSIIRTFKSLDLIPTDFYHFVFCGAYLCLGSRKILAEIGVDEISVTLDFI